MNRKPELVIMAAGMGSRYGGLKQIDPMDDAGHIIIDFSLYDACRAGFETVNFLIKPEMEAEFRACIGDRVANYLQVRYIFQRQDDLPSPFAVPARRTKPWGTGHAIRACREVVDTSFAVINADDYYGQSAFTQMYDFLAQGTPDFAMIGYRLENTLAEAGSVCRGECAVNPATGCLEAIHERIGIERREGIIGYSEEDRFVALAPNTVVSMNLWGFTPAVFDALERGFTDFLRDSLESDPLKCEYYLPSVVDCLLAEQKAVVRVMTSRDHWYGVTYREDKPVVKAAFDEMKRLGKYPDRLLD